MDDVLTIWRTAPKGEELMKAMNIENRTEPKSAIIDPYNYTGMSAGTRTKPSIIPYSTLRRMSMVPAIAAIIQTRLNQVARFAKRPRYDGDFGFEIRLKDRNKQMSEAAKKRAMEIEDFFLNTGSVPNRKRKDNFNMFLRKIVRDTLTLDVMCWENVPNMKGELSEIWAVDGATIELVAQAPVSDAFELPVYVPQTARGMKAKGEIAYVQRINGQIVAEYTEEELAYVIRNPRTDLEWTDFGISELEILIEIVTGILNGVRYNTAYFTHNHLPQGVLEIVGKYKDEHLEAFKRHWRNLTSGAEGKWTVPVMALEDGQGFKFTPFKQSNRDMEFNQFLEFLFNVACAVYQIDPNEVGFKSWTSGTKMSASDNTEAKIESSQDKGFIPLMNFLSDSFNSEIMQYIDPEFEFCWVGLDDEDEDKRNERDKLLLEMGLKVVDEVRKERGWEPFGAAWANAPANSTLMQVYMAESGLNAKGQAQGQEAEQEADQQEAAQQQADDQHQKELEKMEREHEMAKEMEQLKHKNAMELEKVRAQSRKADAAQNKAPDKKQVKKSLTASEDDRLEIVVTWDGY